MAIISLSGRTWVANDTVNQMLDAPLTDTSTRFITFTLDFECDGVAYTSIGLNTQNVTSTLSDHKLSYEKSDGTYVTAATGSTWSDDKYKTLTFPEDGNGHTDFTTIRFLYENGTFTPEIEEMKDGETVSFSFVNCPTSTSGSSPRLILYPYSNDTKEQLSTNSIFDVSYITPGTILELPICKDVIYGFRANNTALNGTTAPSLDGVLLPGFAGATEAVNNCYGLSGGETLVFDHNNYTYTSDGSATALRWAIVLGGGSFVVTPTEITYNGATTSVEVGQTTTLSCAEKKAVTDIVAVFGSAGTITYNGAETSVEAGQTATMECEDKKMLTDVVIEVIATHALYNWVRLPIIPEDVLASYPYAWIRHNTTSGYYDLFFSPEAFYAVDSSTISGSGITKPWYRVEIATAESATGWTYYKDSTANLALGTARTVLWSNHDIPNGSATATDIYFYGTDPVPTV